MSEQAIVTIISNLITSIPPTIAALAAWIYTMRGNEKIRVLREEVNGRISELIDARVREAIAAERLEALKRNPPSA